MTVARLLLLNKLLKMKRIVLFLTLLVFFHTPLNAGATEAPTFDIKNGVNPVQLNQSGKFLSAPSGISTTPAGDYLLVADPGNNEIKVLDTGKLKQLSQFGKGDLADPHDVAFDPKGRLLVADTKNDRIMIYKFDGVYRDGSPNIEYLATISDGLSAPKGVAAGTGGRIYIANTGDNSVLLIKDGKIITRITAAGPAETALSGPIDVHIDSAGHVLVSDSGNKRVLVFDFSLKFQQELSTEKYGFKRPGRISSDDAGLIFIADEGRDEIGIIDSRFKPKGRINASSTRPGGLIRPQGIETIGRYMWVTDTGNNRVILYKRE